MEDDDCHTRLGLGLSIISQNSRHDHEPAEKQPIINHPNFFLDDCRKKSSRKKKATTCLDLSFKLFPKDDDDDDDETAINDDNNNDIVVEEPGAGRELATKSPSSIDDTGEQQQYKSGGHKEVAVGGGRKKLRLSKEQSCLLENRFKLQTTLNTAQKQSLAEQLKLTPRQVEVWFQNRRARTKLKQTEVDCEFLKKCCERLTSENTRLKKELQELRSGRNEPCAQILTTCQSCQNRNVSQSGKCTTVSSQ